MNTRWTLLRLFSLTLLQLLHCQAFATSRGLPEQRSLLLTSSAPISTDEQFAPTQKIMSQQTWKASLQEKKLLLQAFVSPSKLKWALFLAAWLGFPQPSLNLEQDVLPLARQWANNTDDTSSNLPLKGVTVVLTGAASGIGLGLTQQLIKLGATVIALDRSMEKLMALQQQHTGVVPVKVQLDDLESVKEASQEIQQKYDSIDILINCAGTNYFMAGNTSTTTQNIDVSFGVNYLSHFLLTEQMLPLLMKSKFNPTILQISSSFHWAVDGSELVVDDQHKMPTAAKPKGRATIFFKTQRAYANSKLAQLMHARAVQRRHPSIVVRSVCPGWVSTPILGPAVQKIVLSPFGFRSNGFGLKSALYAIFQPPGQDFFTNTGISGLIHCIPKFVWAPLSYTLRLRDLVATIYATMMLQTQRFAPFIKARRSSPESYNEERQEALYNWSYETVKSFL